MSASFRYTINPSRCSRTNANGLGGKTPGNAAAAQTADERFSQLLADIHEDLKAVVPQTAMSRQAQQFAQAVRSPRHSDQAHDKKSGKQSGKQTRAVGPDIRIETEAGKESLKPLPGTDMAARIRSIRGKAKAVQSLFAEIDKSFKETEQHLKQAKLPREILDRHTVAVSEYETRKANFVRLTGKLEQASGDSSAQQAALEDLGSFMARYPNAKPHQYTDPNKLPFGTPSGKVREPFTSKEQYQASLFPPKYDKIMLASTSLNGVKLAQAVLPETPAPADTAETEDVQITQAIRDKATELNNNPVQIYNWVRNNIQFIPSYGSIQGSDMTLLNKRGNAFDTASLLIALYRAAGIPARYVYGTIEVPADKVMNWVGGVTKAEAAQSLLGQGGIPNIGVVSGGKITKIRLEHVWVEAYVDYTPSRGAINKTPNTWVPVDASFKQYSFTSGMDIENKLPVNLQNLLSKVKQGAILNETGGYLQNLNRHEYLKELKFYQDQIKNYIEGKGANATLEEVFGDKKIIASNSSIFMGSLPYSTIEIAKQFSSLPEKLRHEFTLKLYKSSSDKYLGIQNLEKKISFSKLANRRLGISYLPATSADEKILKNYQDNPNVDYIPPYLVKVIPQVKLDDEVIAIGDAVTMGQDQYWETSFKNINDNLPYSHQYLVTSGDEIVFGLNGNGITQETVKQRG